MGYVWVSLGLFGDCCLALCRLTPAHVLAGLMLTLSFFGFRVDVAQTCVCVKVDSKS